MYVCMYIHIILIFHGTNMAAQKKVALKTLTLLACSQFKALFTFTQILCTHMYVSIHIFLVF